MIFAEPLTPDYVEELDIPVKIDNAEKHRPIFNYDNEYTVTLREHFSQLMACEACNYPHKTYERVVVRNDVTGQEHHIGVYCLVENFDITEAQLYSNLTPVTLLLETWRRYIIKPHPDIHAMDSRDAELNAMLQLLPLNLSFTGPATDGALSLIERLVKYKAYISDFKSEIEALQTFLGLQHDHLYQTDLFSDRGFNLVNHPKLTKAEQQAATVFFATPEQATWRQVRELHEVFGKARRAQIPTHRIVEVPPYLYTTTKEYRDHLQNYMMSMCNRDARAYEMHNYARQVEQIIEADIGNPNSQLVRDRFATYSLAFESEAVSDSYAVRRSLVQLIEQKGYSHYFSSRSKPFKQRTERRDTGSLRSLQRESQLAEGGERKSGLLEKGHFRQLALWKPERWHKAFAVWQKYGDDVVEGRRILENPTSQL